MAVFCNSLMWFPGTLLTYCLNDFDMIPVAHIITGITFVFTVHIRCIAALLFGRSQDRSPVVSLGIFSVVPSDKTMCPEVDSASENEYQGFLLG